MKPIGIMKRRTPPAAGGGYSPPSFRYWRFLVSKNSANTYAMVARLELLALDGNGKLINVATGGTASASSTFSGWNGASAVFDINTAVNRDEVEAWASANTISGGNTEWLKYDLGAGNAKAVVGMAFHCGTAGSDNTVYDRAPVDYKLQGSNDDSAWTDVITKTNDFLAAPKRWVMRRYFRSDFPSYTGSLYGARRYWRLYCLEGDGACSVGEIALRPTVGGSPHSAPGTITASSTDGSNVASRAIDGNSSTFWSASQTGPQYRGSLLMDYGSGNEKIAAEFAFTARNDGFPSFSADVVYLQCSENSTGPWATVIPAHSTGGFTAGQTKTFSDSLFV